MTEPSVEKIVARLEREIALRGQATLLDNQFRVLIASWRERGEALKEIAKQKTDAELGDDGPFGSNHDFVEGYDCCIKCARDALAAEPASGETNHCPDGRLCVCNKDGAGCMRADEAPPPPPTQGESDKDRAFAIAVELERLSGIEGHVQWPHVLTAALRQRADEEREKVARWMIAHSYATGHGDTIEDLLVELAGEATRAENEACAALAERNPFAQALDIAAAIRARIKP